MVRSNSNMKVIGIRSRSIEVYQWSRSQEKKKHACVYCLALNFERIAGTSSFDMRVHLRNTSVRRHTVFRAIRFRWSQGLLEIWNARVHDDIHTTQYNTKNDVKNTLDSWWQNALSQCTTDDMPTIQKFGWLAHSAIGHFDKLLGLSGCFISLNL